jgi:hypothetical protein
MPSGQLAAPAAAADGGLHQYYYDVDATQIDGWPVLLSFVGMHDLLICVSGKTANLFYFNVHTRLPANILPTVLRSAEAVADE